MIEEAQKYGTEQRRKERITRLVASMLAGTTAPGDALITQVVTIASVIADKIEAGVL